MTLKRLVLLAPLATLALLMSGGSAQAKTTIVEPPGSWHPYQQWVDEAFVPTPELTITVFEEVEPCGGLYGCTDGASQIGIEYQSGGMRPVFLHELGHIWEQHIMKPIQRERFVHLIRQPEMSWYGEYNQHFLNSPAVEWFADAYSLCARVRKIPRRGNWEIGDGIVGAPAMQRICGMIRG